MAICGTADGAKVRKQRQSVQSVVLLSQQSLDEQLARIHLTEDRDLEFAQQLGCSGFKNICRYGTDEERLCASIQLDATGLEDVKELSCPATDLGVHVDLESNWLAMVPNITALELGKTLYKWYGMSTVWM